VALSKPAYQSSTYSQMLAGLAVDGRYDTVSCTYISDVHPWWAVDLEAAYSVVRITVTNDHNTNYRKCRWTLFIYYYPQKDRYCRFLHLVARDRCDTLQLPRSMSANVIDHATLVVFLVAPVATVRRDSSSHVYVRDKKNVRGPTDPLPLQFIHRVKVKTKTDQKV